MARMCSTVSGANTKVYLRLFTIDYNSSLFHVWVKACFGRKSRRENRGPNELAIALLAFVADTLSPTKSQKSLSRVRAAASYNADALVRELHLFVVMLRVLPLGKDTPNETD